ncbi:metallophosphoesterase domain-containing protein [Heterostelium album PN500]|uniref:Purple acid phosphatase n=1 Tax=Heterostelium pallidum (strain ATCC 26659 / Pp 5 / PN500) TaxID=670386 RepID=D3B6U1_HETP5|nr:metallophosphoesterase domain-containing protein [Heterostelium album PN500]EFA83061.1 metallophosphoesterase domain-containing protein [Heterostelium album PN500]|eukprot:XP_020435178.1 metallophosphoesterase domain-containing protein [Heterostelium album PN500]
MFSMKYISLTICLLLIINGCCLVATAANNLTPSSIKLSLTQKVSEMRVTWYTPSKGSSPIVLFGTSPFVANNSIYEQSVVATIEDLISVDWSGYTNTALLSGLLPLTTYFYAVGEKNEQLFSDVYNFTTAAADYSENVDPFSIVVYGDMGIYGGSHRTLARIVDRLDDFKFAIHVGDIAYADVTKASKDVGNETVWNEFLDMINPVSSHIPYMVCPGNHDIFFINFGIYRRTFNMPAPSLEDSWYSFDYNGVHFVSYSTEHLILPLSPQHDWLENDLKTYRMKNPGGWIVLYAHRPFYCSTSWSYCVKDDYKVMLQDSLEYLLFEYNVDLFIGGHAHSYERTLPVYAGNVANYGTYDAPKATVHLVVGTGGCQEGPDPGWQQPAPIWSTGERLLDVGYGVVSFANNTHLQYQFINTTSNTVRDEFWLTKGFW